MISFHTPELPDPLNLDLARLRGGGSCPSQFYGETHDGLDIYVRYRSGRLRVHIGTEPGDDAYHDGNCILEADIGHPLDGSISLTQFCKHFGVTINGTIPGETDPDSHRYADLTGRTTSWSAHLNRVTIETSRRIVGKACSAFPDALLVKPVTNDQSELERLILTDPDTIDTLEVWLIHGPSLLKEIDTNPVDYVLPKAGQLQISIRFPGWKYPAPRYTSQLRQAEKDLERTLFVPGERNMPTDIELAIHSMNLGAGFPSGDHEARNALEGLGDIISNVLPATKLERFDLASGEALDQIERPTDPVIVEWCNSASDRWLHIERENINSPWIGIRPADR